MREKNYLWRMLAVVLAFSVIAAACGSDDDGGAEDATADESGDAEAEEPAAEPAEEASGEMQDVRLQLQWVPQSQFAGYFAAVAEGFYEDAGLNVTILDGGGDVPPATVLDSGAAEFAISWVPRGLVPREEGLNITNIAQVFQRSGTLQVSLAEAGITTPEDLAGKNVGNWGGGNEFELFAGLRSVGLDPNADVTQVQQDFSMNALLNGDIDSAMAMTYNEYAAGTRDREPRHRRVVSARRPDGHRLERRRNGDVAGCHLGRRRQARRRPCVSGDRGEVPRSLVQGLGLLP